MSEQAPYASDPAQSRGRLHSTSDSPTRSEFQRDRDRIIHSTAFRRLEYKIVQENPTADDIVLSKGDATVLIDALSLEFMGGAEIDYVDDLIGQSFQIKNPNAVAGCGCGTSFSVAV